MFPNWHQNNIAREILKNKYLKISFSQNGEDDFITSYYWDKISKSVQGTYLDIGSYHETAFSNTKLLSLAGWLGIAIDANPDFKNPWISARPKDDFINCCIAPSGEVKKEMEFYRFETPAMSTANKNRAKEMISSGINLIDTIKVPSLTLIELLEEPLIHNLEKIDFVNIDLEATDYLDDLPFFLKNIKPSLLCFEVISKHFSIQNMFDSKEFNSLSQSGYEIISVRGENILAVPMG